MFYYFRYDRKVRDWHVFTKVDDRFFDNGVKLTKRNKKLTMPSMSPITRNIALD